MTRRQFAATLGAVAIPGLGAGAEPRHWRLGINTYCLRFQRWNDRQLVDYCISQKLDAIFLQDSLDPAAMDPRHWAEVRAWTKEAGLHIETGGGAILPRSAEDTPRIVAALERNIERAAAMGSPMCGRCLHRIATRCRPGRSNRKSKRR